MLLLHVLFSSVASDSTAPPVPPRYERGRELWSPLICLAPEQVQPGSKPWPSKRSMEEQEKKNCWKVIKWPAGGGFITADRPYVRKIAVDSLKPNHCVFAKQDLSWHDVALRYQSQETHRSAWWAIQAKANVSISGPLQVTWLAMFCNLQPQTAPVAVVRRS